MTTHMTATVVAALLCDRNRLQCWFIYLIAILQFFGQRKGRFTLRMAICVKLRRVPLCQITKASLYLVVANKSQFCVVRIWHDFYLPIFRKMCQHSPLLFRQNDNVYFMRRLPSNCRTRSTSLSKLCLKPTNVQINWNYKKTSQSFWQLKSSPAKRKLP